MSLEPHDNKDDGYFFFSLSTMSVNKMAMQPSGNTILCSLVGGGVHGDTHGPTELVRIASLDLMVNDRFFTPFCDTNMGHSLRLLTHFA